MTDQPNLEALYLEARQALKRREYDRAAALLKQILLADENYRDTSSLLAQAVRLKRRRWYNDARVWGTLGALILIGTGVWLGPRLLASLPARVALHATAQPSAAIRLAPSLPVSATVPPFLWVRVGQFDAEGAELAMVNAIVPDPVDPDILYAITDGASIYRTIDRGDSWKPIHAGLTDNQITTLLIDPTDPAVLYAGAMNRGVFRSTDRGDTWQAITMGFLAEGEASFAGTLAMDPNDSRHLYFATDRALYETRDSGERWASVKQSSCPQGFIALAVHPGDGDRLFALGPVWDALCPNALYTSADAGRTWMETYRFETIATRLYINPLNANLYVNSGPPPAFLRSQDGGLSWKQLRDVRCPAVWFDPLDAQMIYCGRPGNLEGTQDGGANWQSLISEAEASFRALAISPRTGEIWAGGTRVIVSIDGGRSWNERSNGIGKGGATLLADPYRPGRVYIIQGLYEELYRYDAGGSLTYLGGVGGGLAFGNEPDLLLAWLEDKSQEPWISRDAGLTWEAFPRADLPFHYSAPQIAYRISSENLEFQFTRDGGGTWQTCPSENPNVLVWALDPKNPERLIIAQHSTADAQQADGLYAIRVSLDGCQNWRSLSPVDQKVLALALDPANPDTIYAGTAGGAYVSFDGGATWNQINDGLLGALVMYSLAVDDEGHVYAATPYGIFRLEGK